MRGDLTVFIRPAQPGDERMVRTFLYGLMPDSQFIDNVQWHCLLPVDLTFNPAVPNQFCHYTDKELFRFTDDVKSVGGAITINVPIEVETGHVPQDSLAQLGRLGKHLKTKGQQ